MPTIANNPLLAAVDLRLLENHNIMGNVDSIDEKLSIETITDDQVKTFTNSIVSDLDGNHETGPLASTLTFIIPKPCGRRGGTHNHVLFNFLRKSERCAIWVV